MDGPSPGRRLGIFGGTFDPPHVGHLVVAQDVFDALGLDDLLFVPAGRPPHRPAPAASAEQRLRMVRTAVGSDPRFAVSDAEVRREGPSYTVDTLREVGAASPGASLFLVIGADQWAGFSTWRNPDEIGRLAEIVVMARDGERPRTEARVGSGESVVRCREVQVTRVDVSASLVRERAAAGRSLRYLVPEPVREIIERENLYLR